MPRHQLMAVLEGARLRRSACVVHGKSSLMTHSGKDLFAGIPSPTPVMRYHSWEVDPASLPRRSNPWETLPTGR
ncbi:MAG: hypothetical protein HC923_03595 [Myxococcales bacterium]|nr:hypothetical protein [Myxococcales bacterium]